MIGLPEGFNLSQFIGDIVSYVGIPIITVSCSLYVYRLITYIMHLGGKSQS